MSDTRASPPRWAVIAGAALAAVIATGVPGLAAVLRELDAHGADAAAVHTEVPLALSAAIFGALQTRAQFLKRRRGVGVLLLFINGALAFFIGIGIVLSAATGTTDGGPVLILGSLAAVAAALLQTALGGLSWWRIAANVRAAEAGEGAGRAAFALSLLIASAAHLLLKSVSGGSVWMGAVGAICAIAVVWPARRLGTKASNVTVISALIAVAGLGFQARGCAEQHDAAAIDELPRCETATEYDSRHPTDALGKRARTVPGVADAVADADFVPVTVYVLPTGGGALPEATRAAVEHAVAGVECSFYVGSELRRAEHVAVKGASYVRVDVTANYHPGDVVPEGAEQLIADALRAKFDLTQPHVELVQIRGRQSFSEPSAPGTGGWIDYRVADQPLSERATHEAAGTVLQIGKVDVIVIRRDGG